MLASRPWRADLSDRGEQYTERNLSQIQNSSIKNRSNTSRDYIARELGLHCNLGVLGVAGKGSGRAM